MARSRTGAWRWTRVGGRRRSIKVRGHRRALVTADPISPHVVRPVQRDRRELTDEEVISGIDFDEMEEQLERAIVSTLNDWRDVKRRLVNDLVVQVRKANNDPVRLANINATVRGEDVLLRNLRRVTQQAGTSALKEAASQGVEAAALDTSGVQGYLDKRAQAAAHLLARSLSESAARQAVRLASPNVTPSSLAQAVRQHLEGLSDAFLRDSFNALYVGGVNLARQTVFGVLPKGRYFSSAVLDRNTCPECRRGDGQRFASLVAIQAVFPFGGRADCRGRLRCRCTVIAVFREQAV
jgi:hypothetical protein